MCMLVVARRVHPRYPLIVVANRDEVLDRRTEQGELTTLLTGTGTFEELALVAEHLGPVTR